MQTASEYKLSQKERTDWPEKVPRFIIANQEQDFGGHERFQSKGALLGCRNSMPSGARRLSLRELLLKTLKCPYRTRDPFMSNVHHNNSIAFLIGEDYARYGLPQPEESNSAFADGYRYGRTQHSRPKTPDRFVRKWLQVRLNAWRRNRHVDAALTPEFLRAIDVERCPVSGVVLTHGTGADTDWSVDRVDNDGGYTPQNLMLVSTRVNRAKGALDILSLLRIGHPVDNPTLELPPLVVPDEMQALSREEKRRLAWFAGSTDITQDYPAREFDDLRATVTHLPRGFSSVVQHHMVDATSWSRSLRDDFWKALAAWTGRNADMDGKAVLQRVRKGVEAYAIATLPPSQRRPGTAFANDVLWQDFATWWIWLAQTRYLKNVVEMLSQHVSPDKLISAVQLREDKKAATKGFA